LRDASEAVAVLCAYNCFSDALHLAGKQEPGELGTALLATQAGAAGGGSDVVGGFAEFDEDSDESEEDGDTAPARAPLTIKVVSDVVTSAEALLDRMRGSKSSFLSAWGDLLRERRLRTVMPLHELAGMSSLPRAGPEDMLADDGASVWSDATSVAGSVWTDASRASTVASRASRASHSTFGGRTLGAMTGLFSTAESEALSVADSITASNVAGLFSHVPRTQVGSIFGLSAEARARDESRMAKRHARKQRRRKRRGEQAAPGSREAEEAAEARVRTALPSFGMWVEAVMLHGALLAMGDTERARMLEVAWVDLLRVCLDAEPVHPRRTPSVANGALEVLSEPAGLLSVAGEVWARVVTTLPHTIGRALRRRADHDDAWDTSHARAIATASAETQSLRCLVEMDTFAQRVELSVVSNGDTEVS
jgi:hypothetical protein